MRKGDADELSGPPRAVSQGRWEKNGKRYPLWADDPGNVWRRGLIPASLLRPDPDGEKAFNEWARQAAGSDSEQLIELIRHGAKLRGLFAQFNLPFLSLPRSTPKATALDVFVKMNTSAQPLSTYDIVVAQVEAGPDSRSMSSWMNCGRKRRFLICSQTHLRSS